MDTTGLVRHDIYSKHCYMLLMLIFWMSLTDVFFGEYTYIDVHS